MRDNQGGAATTNVALRVNGHAETSKGYPTTLPLTVYSEAAEPSAYIPSDGWATQRQFTSILGGQTSRYLERRACVSGLTRTRAGAV